MDNFFRDRGEIDNIASYFSGLYRQFLVGLSEKWKNLDSISSQRQTASLILDIQRQLREVDRYADSWIKMYIPKMFHDGDTFAQEQLRALGYTEYSSLFTSFHEAALQVAMSSMRKKIFDATKDLERTLAGFIHRIQVSDKKQKLILKDVVETISQGQTSKLLSKNIAVRLAAKASGGYITAGSKIMSIEHYATLLARTNLRVAMSRGTESRLLSNGIDLVRISSHNTDCKLCAPFEGKIFSISGKTEGYPPISILPNEGTPIHPNCMHMEQPFVIELATPEDFAEGILKPSDWPFPKVPQILIEMAA